MARDKKKRRRSKGDESPQKRHGKGHHIVPSSQGGSDSSWNKYHGWSPKKHNIYHQLYYNHLPSWVILFTLWWRRPDGSWDEEKMGAENVRRVRELWGDKSPAAVIAWIAKWFLPVEEKHFRGEI